MPLRAILCLALITGCGDDKAAGNPAVFDDYEDENITVIGDATDSEDTAGDNRIFVAAPSGDEECIQVADNLCVPPDASGDWCSNDGGPVDIIVVDGQVEEVICYPSPDNDGKPEEIVGEDHEGNIDVLQNANRTAITFDAATDGVPIAGDVDVEGNNVSIYGNGPDNTIIDGDVTLSGNKSRLRGVTITGNLTINLNNAAVILCRVLGDVNLTTESTNNSIFVENDVFGNFVTNSNNHLITGNDIQGEWTLEGNGITCDANHGFEDTNEDQVVADEERGDLLVCP